MSLHHAPETSKSPRRALSPGDKCREGDGQVTSASSEPQPGGDTGHSCSPAIGRKQPQGLAWAPGRQELPGVLPGTSPYSDQERMLLGCTHASGVHTCFWGARGHLCRGRDKAWRGEATVEVFFLSDGHLLEEKEKRETIRAPILGRPVTCEGPGEGVAGPPGNCGLSPGSSLLGWPLCSRELL